MKYIILVGDGMGDLPLPELNNCTPLEKASIPTMDLLAGKGEMFLVRTIPAGMPPGSDIANLSLLGYLPHEFYTGRAPLEAASLGITLNEDEIACRCNLVTLDFPASGGITMVDYSAGHISTAEAGELIKALNSGLQSNLQRFCPGISYRHLLIYNGILPGLITVPPHDHIGKDVSDYWQQYLAVPRLHKLLDTARTILDGHAINRKRLEDDKLPANAIWLWGEGKAPVMPNITDQYGISGALISAVDLLKGIGFYAGLEIINVPGATGYLDTDYEGKARAALAALQEKDLVFVHVEAPDEAGHQGLVAEKIQAIEDFDRRIVKPILAGAEEMNLPDGFRMVVAMDHYTPISLRTHIDKPVPIILYDSVSTTPGSALGFTEKNAESTGSMLANGRLFLEKLLTRD